MEGILEKSVQDYKIRRSKVEDIIKLLIRKPSGSTKNLSEWYSFCTKNNPKRLHALLFTYIPDKVDFQKILTPTQTEIVAIFSQNLDRKRIEKLKSELKDYWQRFFLLVFEGYKEQEIPRDNDDEFSLSYESLSKEKLRKVWAQQNNWWGFNNFQYLEFPTPPEVSSERRQGTMVKDNITICKRFEIFWNLALKKSYFL